MAADKSLGELYISAKAEIERLTDIIDLRQAIAEDRQAELNRLRKLLEGCSHDSDWYNGEDFPVTINDYLSLLSAYWWDVIPEDEKFDWSEGCSGAWEKMARPVLARLTSENAILRSECDDSDEYEEEQQAKIEGLRKENKELKGMLNKIGFNPGGLPY